MSSQTKDPATYRVVQWATGNVGTRALRAVIEHPQLMLAGVYVHSAEKAGRDAGDLCGLPPVGVTATNKIEDIIALGADCVLYMPAACDFDEVCRLLASGANIVTTRGEFLDPDSLDPAMRTRVEEACRQGGTSIHSTGSSPGFITEAVPLVMTSLERRLDLLTIDEFADVSSRDSPDMLFNLMGFGQQPFEFNEHRLHHVRESFGPSLRLLAKSIGMPLDAIEASGEVDVARNPVHIAAGVVEAGTVAAQRITVSGVRNGQTLLRFRANWYISTDIDKDWELRETGWRMLLEGDTPLDISIRFPVPLEQWAAFTPGLTAHRPVNAIAYVCAAEPGIRTTADLPQIIANLG